MDTGNSVSSLSPMVAEAAAAAQRAAAAFMASQKSPQINNSNMSTISSQVTNSVSNSSLITNSGSILPTKATVSFVIPKNKLGVSKSGQTSGALVALSPSISKLDDNDEPKKVQKEEQKRKTRWGPDLLEDPIVRRGRALALQTRAEQIAAQLEIGNLEIDTNEATRSPSPPPIYGENGQRLNTREGRKREQLDLERREAVGECIQLNPSFKPPAGFKPVMKDAKLFLPVKEYPGYNFIGLILGPRGNTQKRMEQETGAKIAIRGKGAVKDGKQGLRRDGKLAEGANEDLHVYISADTIEKVDAAVALIEPLLTPVDETRNSHKRKQLQELAKMNGTMRDFYCSICGEAGHRDFHCPKDKMKTFQANVTCGICGDGGHPTVDCPLKLSGATEKVMDKEYAKLLAELGGGPISQPQILSIPRNGPMASAKTKFGGGNTRKMESEDNLYSFGGPGGGGGLGGGVGVGGSGVGVGVGGSGVGVGGGGGGGTLPPTPPPAWAMALAASMTRDSQVATDEDIEKYANDEWGNGGVMGSNINMPMRANMSMEANMVGGSSGTVMGWGGGGGGGGGGGEGGQYGTSGYHNVLPNVPSDITQVPGNEPVLPLPLPLPNHAPWSVETSPPPSVEVRNRLSMGIGPQGGLLGPPPSTSFTVPSSQPQHSVPSVSGHNNNNQTHQFQHGNLNGNSQIVGSNGQQMQAPMDAIQNQSHSHSPYTLGQSISNSGRPVSTTSTIPTNQGPNNRSMSTIPSLGPLPNSSVGFDQRTNSSFSTPNFGHQTSNQVPISEEYFYSQGDSMDHSGGGTMVQSDSRNGGQVQNNTFQGNSALPGSVSGNSFGRPFSSQTSSGVGGGGGHLGGSNLTGLSSGNFQQNTTGQNSTGQNYPVPSNTANGNPSRGLTGGTPILAQSSIFPTNDSHPTPWQTQQGPSPSSYTGQQPSSNSQPSHQYPSPSPSSSQRPLSQLPRGNISHNNPSQDTGNYSSLNSHQQQQNIPLSQLSRPGTGMGTNQNPGLFGRPPMGVQDLMPRPIMDALSGIFPQTAWNLQQTNIPTMGSQNPTPLTPPPWRGGGGSGPQNSYMTPPPRSQATQSYDPFAPSGENENTRENIRVSGHNSGDNSGTPFENRNWSSLSSMDQQQQQFGLMTTSNSNSLNGSNGLSQNGLMTTPNSNSLNGLSQNSRTPRSGTQQDPQFRPPIASIPRPTVGSSPQVVSEKRDLDYEQLMESMGVM